jgi:P-type Ca2+ transporter type 2C
LNITDTSFLNGLTSQQAAQQHAHDGANALDAAQRRTVWTRLWVMLREPMFALLVLAALLYLVLGGLTEGITLFVFVLAVLALTFYQEGKSEAAIDALRQLSQPFAQVMRDGRRISVPSRDVVVGDVLYIAEGDRIAADAWVLQADQLQVDESLLTGESLAVTKVGAAFDEALARSQQPGGDELAAVFGGTFVIRGQGVVRVTATGMRSQMGRIGASLNEIETVLTPLQKQTAQLVKVLAWITFGLCVLMILTLGLRNGMWLPALLSGIALAMAILPEEYPVVMAIFPALGARRLAQEGVLTRHINAIETLGATTVLCTDKTGTLTENRMTVAALAVEDASAPRLFKINGESLPEDFHGLVEHAILASAPQPFDPMEVAFHALGQTWLHDEHLHPDWALVQTYALSPALRAMSHVWRASEDAAHVVSAKGAPEAVMDLCHLSSALKVRWGAVVHAMASDGLRVLAVAQGRFVGNTLPSSAHSFNFEWLGLIGLSDPLRAEIPQAIADCHSARIKIIMITGDYPQTARVIANQAGLQGGETLTGDTIDAISDEALSAHLQSVSVCARISPHQKLRIVQALKRNGEVVAMTGDGVNDAPALRAAHVGIAMGARGTDVAREASSLVLVDDNFASIVKGIRLGRRIFGNLQKSMAYIFAIHIPIAGLALVPMVFALPPLLMPVHIALLELVVDPSCSIAFENEPADAQVMQRSPRDTLAPIFGFQQMLASFFQGLCVLAATGAAYWQAWALAAEMQRAMVLITLVAANAMLIFVNGARNAVALWVMAGAMGLVLLGVYVPWLATPMNLAPLGGLQLMTALGLGVASILGAWVCLHLLRYDGLFKGAEHGGYQPN